MPYYREHPLNIDIDKLGKCYFDIKSKLSFKSDDKSLIDFNASWTVVEPSSTDAAWTTDGGLTNATYNTNFFDSDSCA